LRRYFILVLRHQRAVVLLCLLVSVLALWNLRRAVVASSIGKMFLDEHPGYELFLERSEIYGGQDLLVVGFDAPELLSAPTSQRLRSLVDSIEALPEVERVLSVLDVLRAERGADGLRLEPYVELASQRPERVAEYLEALRADPVAGDLLLSADGASTLLLVELTVDRERPAERGPAIVRTVGQLFADAGFDDEDLHLGGMMAVLSAVMIESLYSITTLLPVTMALLIVMVFLIFRQLWPVVLTGGVAVLSVLWTMSFAVLLDPEVNIFMSMVPVVMVVVAFSDVIHLVSAYLLELGRGHAKHEAILASASDVGAACLLTSATTFVGFVSISLVPTPIFRQVGAVFGVGVGVALLLAMTLVPIGLSWLPEPRPWTRRSSTVQGTLDGVLGFAERLAVRRPHWVIAGYAVLTVLAVGGVFNMRVETEFSKRMAEDHRVRRDSAWIEERFAGVNVLDVFVTTPEDEGLLDPQIFARAADTQAALQALPEVDRAVSLVDAITTMHGTLYPEQEGRLPAHRTTLARHILMLESAEEADLDRLVDPERRTLRVGLRLDGEGFRGTYELGRLAESLGRERLGPEYRVEASGLTFLLGGWLGAILTGQRRGLGVSIAAITLMMMIGLRSVSVGLWSMIPNLLPLLFLGGYVGLAWPAVDSDTLIVAMMAIGIGVDDTIHFLMRYRIEAARASSPQEAIGRTMTFAGRAIVITSVILVVGFAPTATSDYFTTRILGTLLPMTLVHALLADLLLVPALVRVGAIGFRRRRGS
jgi:predicted RND superfamily exporter protein